MGDDISGIKENKGCHGPRLHRGSRIGKFMGSCWSQRLSQLVQPSPMSAPWPRAGSAKRTLRDQPKATQAARSGGALPRPHDLGLLQPPQGLHLKACLPHPGSVGPGVGWGGTQSDDMFKSTEIASKKNEV